MLDRLTPDDPITPVGAAAATKGRKCCRFEFFAQRHLGRVDFLLRRRRAEEIGAVDLGKRHPPPDRGGRSIVKGLYRIALNRYASRFTAQ